MDFCGAPKCFLKRDWEINCSTDVHKSLNLEVTDILAYCSKQKVIKIS